MTTEGNTYSGEELANHAGFTNRGVEAVEKPCGLALAVLDAMSLLSPGGKMAARRFSSRVMYTG